MTVDNTVIFSVWENTNQYRLKYKKWPVEKIYEKKNINNYGCRRIT